MRHHRLAAGISFCDIDGQLILLDLRRDRYFGLGPAIERAFRALIEDAGRVSDGDLERLRAARLIEAAETHESILGAWADPPVRSLMECRGSVARPRIGLLPEIAARLLQARVGARRRRLPETVARVRAFKSPNPESRVPAETFVPTYLASRRLVPIAPNCLRDSLALAFCLARRRISFELIFGVKLAPFAAHCWLQSGSTVLNDSLDSVADFRPILVI